MIVSNWLRMFYARMCPAASRRRQAAWRRRPIRRSVRGLSRQASTLEVRILPAAYMDPNPSPGNGFGNTTLTLNNGNVVVTAPYDDNAGGVDAGAVYLFNGSTGALISTLRGSSANDRVGSGGITRISTTSGAENFLVRSPEWDNGAAANAGAVTWGSGVTGVAGPVSETNSHVGSSTNDYVGNDGITLLYDGTGPYNYVIRSTSWDNAGASDAGAVTWGNGEGGSKGVISAANSLVGTTAGDRVGYNGIRQLSANGKHNYLVMSPYWDNGTASDAGAVTWGDGASGVTGDVEAGNSLVGSSSSDRVGEGSLYSVYNNGTYNYVLVSQNWDNGVATDAGAVTLIDNVDGTSGVINETNSLVGSSAGDRLGSNGVTTLSDNSGVYRYVVNSPNWDNGGIVNAGAVTWGTAADPAKGLVASGNSLIGSSAGDELGSGGISVVSTGSHQNYVVSSPRWDSTTAVDVGAVTMANGSTGTFGVLSSVNSLVGSSAGDQIGSGGVVRRWTGTEESYVIVSPLWDNGLISDVGAVTQISVAAGLTGEVTTANSLYGSTAGDQIGSGGITTFWNGADRYVVTSPNWDNGSIVDAGAVTWVNPAAPKTGAVTSSNSLVGSSEDDQIGEDGITLLYSNGYYDYMVRSSRWDDGAVADVGAVTWVSGATGLTGAVSESNSLIGSSPNDRVGSGGVFTLYRSNGMYSYVVRSPLWDNGAASNAGAATWASGATGVKGKVGISNSLVGSSEDDQVGSSMTTVRTAAGDNYLLITPNWDRGAIVNAGAVTWANGAGGTTGAVSISNSLVGDSANDQIGSWGVSAFHDVNSNYNYVVQSPSWDNGTVANAGAFTWGNGQTGISGSVASVAGAKGRITNNSNISLSSSGTNLMASFGAESRVVVGTIAAGFTNDSPVGVAISNALVAENSVIGTAVGTLSATDLDSPAPFTFALVSGYTDNNSFTLVGNELRTTAVLNAEAKSSYSVRVKVTDQGGSSIERTLTVNVADVDESPLSAVTDVNSSTNQVTENAAADTVVRITARATDSDQSSVITYSLSDDAGGRFKIHSTTGVVTSTGEEIDYEDATSYSITVVATNTASSGTTTSSQTFSINVVNVNEHDVSTPIDNDGDEGAIVDEDHEVGTAVGITAFAEDLDGMNNAVAYYLTDDAGGLFAIDPSTGILTLNAGLDYEAAGGTAHTITVTAYSSDGSSASKDFTITVNDVDEVDVTSPIDTDGDEGAIVDEDHAVGTDIGITAYAEDLDGTDNMVNYRLTDDANGLFSIDVTSGVVTLAAGLDYEALGGSSHTIEVEAESADGSTDRKTFTITVNDVDEHDVSTPVDINGAVGATVVEDLVIGSPVGITASASDADGTDNIVTYSLTTNPGGLFDIDEHTGVVTLAAGLNFEATGGTSHTITVTATSSDGSSAEAVFTIDVTDVDEHDVSTPVDLDGAEGATVAESLTVGSEVGITAFAEDLDGTDNTVTYTLTDDASGLFDIDATTGVVTLAAGLNFEALGGTSHTITVTATSSDSSTASADFTITVADVNEHEVSTPVDTDGTAGATVAENLAIGSAVGITAFAEDLDGSDNTVTYSLTNNARGLFDIDEDTGIVTLAAGLDFEAVGGTSHSITVLATSSDSSTASQTFTITVTDEDEHDVSTPVDINGAEGATVAEDLAVNSPVGITASAEDLDGTDNTVTYTLTDDANGLFMIDATTGVVTLLSALNYETATSHTITVEAESTDGSKASQTFTITVTDVDEFDVGPVTDSNDADNLVTENAAAGTEVGITASAIDADGSATVTYSLTDDADGRFEIDAETGVVTVLDGSLLNFEAATSHQITVQAESSDGSTSSQSFTINLDNVLETPTLQLDDTTVLEGLPAGTTVGNLFLTDAPAGSATYKLVRGTGGTDNGRFRIVGNKLVTRAKFDFEKKSTYSVRIEVKTASGFTEIKVFTISVENVNEKPTAITTSAIGFPETTPIGTDVTTFTGRDPDAESNLTYELVPIAGQSDHESFTLVDGVLKTAVEFDYEEKSIYRLRVRVTDEGGLSYEKQFTIYVRNVNEAPRSLTLSKSTVRENMRKGATVGTFSSFDPDGSSPYKFTLVDGDGSDDNAKFRIVKNKLQTNTKFDFDEQSIFTIRVRVTDKGGASYEKAFIITAEGVSVT